MHEGTASYFGEEEKIQSLPWIHSAVPGPPW